MADFCCCCRGRVLVTHFGLKKPQKTTQFPILSGNNKTTTLLQLFEIEKNSWQTFRITYFFHEVYKRKLFLQLPEFQFFDVLLCLHTADHLTSPCASLTKYHRNEQNRRETRTTCLFMISQGGICRLL